MSNMSYCRFQNTLTDFRDCASSLAEQEKLSPEEKRAARALIREAANMLFDNQLIDDEGNLKEDDITTLLDNCNRERS